MGWLSGCRAPSLELVRSAVTARSCLEGRGSDYERLETLGDAFLKYAVSPGPAGGAGGGGGGALWCAWVGACV